MKRIMLTTATCDNKYLDVLKVFLMSMSINNPEKTLIRADLINGTEDMYSRLHRLYENLEIVHYDLDNTNVDWEKNEHLITVMRLRIPMMWKTLNEDWDQVMTIDSDFIIRKPISSIWDNAVPGTIKIWDRGEEYVKKKKTMFARVQAGVHIFGNSPEIKEYYKAFMDDLGDEWAFHYGQGAIYTVYLKFKDKIRLVQMDTSYNDTKFGKKSIAWHCKHGHLKEKVFRKEFKKYLTLANEIYLK